MDVVNQYEHLKTFKLLPIRLRYFQNFVFFTFNLFKENRAGTLLDSLGLIKKPGPYVTTQCIMYRKSFILFVLVYRQLLVLVITTFS